MNDQSIEEDGKSLPRFEDEHLPVDVENDRPPEDDPTKS